VNYSVETERALLELLEEHDLGAGVTFSDHELVSSRSYLGNAKVQLLANRNLDDRTRYHFSQMVERGYAKTLSDCDDWTQYSIAPQGHDRLEWHRQNTFWHRSKRFVAGVFEKAAASIITPIIVSVLTVLVMKYLGLNQ